MRLVHNTAIRLTAVMVCMIAMLLSAMLTLATNIFALFAAPIAIAVYAAVYAWSSDDGFAARWELGTRRMQTIFALPAAAVIAIASCINDSLRSRIR